MVARRSTASWRGSATRRRRATCWSRSTTERIVAVDAGRAGTAWRQHASPASTLPGLANAHSHAFHRALRGRTQTGPGTFWTWRDEMYRWRRRSTPTRTTGWRGRRSPRWCWPASRVSASSTTSITAPDGTRYADPNAMGAATDRRCRRGRAADHAARHVLPPRRDRSDGGLRPDEGTQRRFSDGTVEQWVDRVEALLARRRVDTCGSAPRSTRCAPSTPTSMPRRGRLGRRPRLRAPRPRVRAAGRERAVPPRLQPIAARPARRRRRAR